ncbi:hypothetical protein K2173_027599 [Erythroxylum novogranatense]|uniref:DNA 3'-5' helicase n=1 Tax=Erythroxylum novogranatense TaxID=1862640 RepID=A0AAV8TZH1_9ROSI|nr:hypothetical protein K2173_027599 [Erythroxylum novogranatense]
MLRENDYRTLQEPIKVITPEQRERISQNYRAAKALLARKRPRLDANRCPISAQISGVKRAPLAEIQLNTPPPLSRNGEISSITCYGEISTFRSGSISEDSENRTITAPPESDFLSDSCVTPLRKPVTSGSKDGFSTRNLLDDDFDESALTEIDAICEQKSSDKEEMQSLRSLGSIELSESRTSSGALESWDKLVTEARNESTSQTLEFGNMPEEYMKYLQSLNERQREAARSDISIPLMIIAGPGSGKTSTMVGRVLVLLSEGISPSNILAMTFTTAAASEMRDRIGGVAGKATAKELTISTFHSFSLQLCRSHAEKLERTSEFLIFGHGHQRRAVIEAVRLLDKEKCGVQNFDASKLSELPNGSMPPEYFKDKSKKWQKFVTQAKASGRTPTDYQKMGDEIKATILGNYNNILQSCNALDYHDLISCSVRLLKDFPEVFKECQESWKAIVIDEFQDTSAMQYTLLRLLASHYRITIVGDDDQSIFSFNGADISGFDSFRQDFPNYKEIRLNKNYRSTRYIVEAAASLIRNNLRRCQLKDVCTDNSSGSKIIIRECQTEQAQCAFVVDKILEITSDGSISKPSYSEIAILYRRQVSGKVFQLAFRGRKIPFNIHGVAFYRKKVVKAIIAMLRTTLPGCDDGPYRQVFKALLPFEKDEKRRVIDHIEKISAIRRSSFISASCDIFNAKISGTFRRSQLTQGRKVLSTLEMISKLVQREHSISAVITSVANMVPQKYLLEQRAVVDVDGGKLLNEDNDIRSVLHYLLDDVSDFLSTHFAGKGEEAEIEEKKGCVDLLKSFIDYITEREKENFRSRRHDNKDSITLTTIHQSKGLEWDIVFIVKANESEIPLLHDFNGIAKENGTSVEEERRLLYVAMTRARKKLFILYVAMDSNWQMLQPSRFLKEIPDHLREIQAKVCMQDLQTKPRGILKETEDSPTDLPRGKQPADPENLNDSPNGDIIEPGTDSTEAFNALNGNYFLKRFTVEDRSVVSHLFHQWAKKKAFHNPKRLLDKVGFVIDERLRMKKNKHKDVLRELKSSLNSEEAFQYAEYVLRWEQIPADERAHLMREKQEHFQKLRIENSMSSSSATLKQIAYLQNLGCTVTPASRLHASRLIEQYKSL